MIHSSAPAGDIPGASAGRVPSAVERCFGLPLEEFRDAHWGRRPLLVRGAQLGRSFDAVATAGSVDAVLSGSALRAPFIRVIQSGTDVAAAQYTTTASVGSERLQDVVDPAALARFWDRGATLVLNSLHRTQEPIGRLSREIGRDLGAHVQANAYITPAGVKGLPAHYDTHDVMVLQIDGSKRWIIHEPVLELPLPAQQGHDVGPATVHPPLIDTVLRPGDALYLPRGYVHAPETRNERSIHLTLGIQAITWVDVLRDLVGSVAADDPALRRAVPLHDAGLAAQQTQDAATRLAAVLAALSPEKAAGHAAKWSRRIATSEPVSVLGRTDHAEALTLDSRVVPRAGGASTVRASADNGVVVVSTPDRNLTVPAALREALQHALNGPTTARHLAGLNPGTTPEQALKLLQHLLRNNVLVLG
ncbi:cupin domain-containing protein [Kitasatospora cineracea]